MTGMSYSDAVTKFLNFSFEDRTCKTFFGFGHGSGVKKINTR